jgi:hypothetical protein
MAVGEERESPVVGHWLTMKMAIRPSRCWSPSVRASTSASCKCSAMGARSPSGLCFSQQTHGSEFQKRSNARMPGDR